MEFVSPVAHKLVCMYSSNRLDRDFLAASQRARERGLLERDYY